MISLPAYDIIRVVNREVDLTRPPVREDHHAFGEDASSPRDDGSGNGGGLPAGPSRLGRLIAAARTATTRGARPLANPLG